MQLAPLKKLSLDDLRSIPGIAPIQKRETLSYSLFRQGIPVGGLTQLVGSPGSGKREAVTAFLKEHPEFRVAWVERRQSLFPPALPNLGIALERFLFVDADREIGWAALQILRSGLFKIVVINQASNEENLLRRIQIATEQSGTATLFLNEQPWETETWAWSLQLQIQRSQRLYDADSIRVHPLKVRGSDSWKKAVNE